MINVILASDASGAASAGRSGMVVVIVDVIDFSTSMEAVIDAGAAVICGAATDAASPPVKTDPFRMGYLAGTEAKRLGKDVLVLAEPRVGEGEKRRQGVLKALGGIESSGAGVAAIIPNIGAEITRLADFSGRVVLGATGTGGVAFDAAICAGSPSVLTGTVARTMAKNGFASARASAHRAVSQARSLGRDIAVVAASGNSLEDILAAEYLYKTLLEMVR